MSDLDFSNIQIKESSPLLEKAMAIAAGTGSSDQKLKRLADLSKGADPDDADRIGELIESVIADS